MTRETCLRETGLADWMGNSGGEEKKTGPGPVFCLLLIIWNGLLREPKVSARGQVTGQGSVDSWNCWRVGRQVSLRGEYVTKTFQMRWTSLMGTGN